MKSAKLSSAWSHWSATSAYSLGTLWVNKCSPSCAAGHYNYYAASVTLSNPKTHNGKVYFSRLTLRYWHGHQRNYVYAWGPNTYWKGGP